MDEKKVDEKSHYVSATVIIVDGNKYLIAKRSESLKNFLGLWTVPGGKLEAKDYKSRNPDTQAGQWYNVLESSSRREVKEEVGLEIGGINYLTSLAFIRPDGIPTLVISFFSNFIGGEVKLSDELTEYRWVTLEEAKNYQLIEGIYEELEMLDNFLKNGKMSDWKLKE